MSGAVLMATTAFARIQNIDTNIDTGSRGVWLIATIGALAGLASFGESIQMRRPPRPSLVFVDHDDAPRLAEVSEADEVGRLLHDFNTEFGTPSPGAEVLSERLAALLASESMFAILAGRPAFAVALVSVRPNVWYSGRVGLLDELYVDPNRRGDGTGSAILILLLDHALTLGVDAIEINVDEGDVDARRFYERHGYSSIEPFTNERAFYYFKELRPPN